MKNSVQLKAKIRNLAKEQNIPHDFILYNYMMGRLLERISKSSYAGNFIIKGGFLISSIVGLSTRTTHDLDTTAKGFSLNKESVLEIFEEIVQIPVGDLITFEIVNVGDIRKDDIYPGVRVKLDAHFEQMRVHLTVDITTGDIITPGEVKTSIPLLFDEGSVEVLTYPFETILAEKLETILIRGRKTTRARDFYDIYLFCHLPTITWDNEILLEALTNTMERRESLPRLTIYPQVLSEIKNNAEQQENWTSYQNEVKYAKGITFDQAIDTVEALLDSITGKS